MRMPEANADFENAPEGNHPARCYRVADLGTQEKKFKGEVTGVAPRILITWEIVTEMMADGRPFSISNFYTFSSNPKSNLVRDLSSWRGKPFEPSELGANGFDLSKLLGVGCLLNIVHATTSTGTYANIAAVTRPPKGLEIAALTNPQVMFDLSNFNQATYDSFGDGLKTMIARSPEYQAMFAIPDEPQRVPQGLTGESIEHSEPDFDDDIPF